MAQATKRGKQRKATQNGSMRHTGNVDRERCILFNKMRPLILRSVKMLNSMPAEKQRGYRGLAALAGRNCGWWNGIVKRNYRLAPNERDLLILQSVHDTLKHSNDATSALVMKLNNVFRCMADLQLAVIAAVEYVRNAGS
jgi:hypothetical protein